MNDYERQQTAEALKRPSPPARPRPTDPREVRHLEREGEYEYFMVRAALKAAARNHEGVK